MTVPPPSNRDEFAIAIICALPLEYDAVSLVFDEFWDECGDQYGRARGDANCYTTGRIGKYNVVLALLPHMGKANAACAAATMCSSYNSLRLALLVGVCGGVPRLGSDDDEILLGDVIISKTIVQYDLGRQYPDRFVRKNTLQDSFSKPNKDICNLLVTFETERGLERLEQRSAHFLKQLQAGNGRRRYRSKYRYPGAADDKLFRSNYRHKHYASPTCICRECHGRSDPVCDRALDSTCDELGCDQRYLVPRERLETKRQLEYENSDTASEPAIHIGPVASGDRVMKIAEKEGVIAFEMEGAGIWEQVPCIVVKGVCDYADCHKNKRWQNYAAATAASTSKAILERYIQTDTLAGLQDRPKV
ncbi:nucleoside phosphorylase domain-containing protein [Thelonectria olida]|uniref:Nucleoside phosphorylase domain-containing protein n=1 Tax=Thelonectria olida TaxID=1576542 RepID=A0A9P8W0A6_9HYPO|nr:nucleoside phosphorylase domain-containing protein [Thelonectria olida]